MRVVLGGSDVKRVTPTIIGTDLEIRDVRDLIFYSFELVRPEKMLLVAGTRRYPGPPSGVYSIHGQRNTQKCIAKKVKIGIASVTIKATDHAGHKASVPKI